MEEKQKSYIRPIVIVMIFAFLTIGYAYLTSVLNINGSTLIKNPTWDVHFENVQVKDGSVTGEQVTQEPEIDTNKTTVSFHVNLKKPGDYYEFTVDAVNAGTIDAMINTYSHFDLTIDQLKYLETSVTYEDGEEIAEKQQLLAGDFAIYKIVVSFKKDLSAEDLPDSPEELDLEFTVEYVQKDDTAIERLAETNSLYNVLKREYDNNGLAKLYNGAHQDSMDASKSTKKIYHWYANNNTDGTAVTNKFNVIFANHCWQMIRTTDTGGVKLLYNGEAENNQCLDTRGTHVGIHSYITQSMSSEYWYGTDYIYDKTTNKFKIDGIVEKSVWNSTTGPQLVGKYTCKSVDENNLCDTLYLIIKYNSSTYAGTLIIDSNSHYSQYGSSQYNYSSFTPAYNGYMYNNTSYEMREIITLKTYSFRTKTNINTSFWYAEDFDWNNGNSTYSLINPFQITDLSESDSIIGKYTFGNTNQNFTSSSIKYIVDVKDGMYYYIEVKSGNSSSDYNLRFIYGDSFSYNNDIYTINNYTSFYSFDWPNVYENTLNKYICQLDSGNSCKTLWYITTTRENNFEYEVVSNNYKFSNSFTYDGEYYTLDNDSVMVWDFANNDELNKIKNAHYTCFNESGVCKNINYVFYGLRGSSNGICYVIIKNGMDVDYVIDQMFYVDDVNTYDSIAKSSVDSWYNKYLLNYSQYLEDIIYCNNRDISSLSGWNPNGGNIEFDMYFVAYSDDLYCTNETDRFSVSNPKAKLNYKTALISSRDMFLLGNDKIRSSGQRYWVMTPRRLGGQNAYHGLVSSSGDAGDFNTISSEAGIRPTISLRPSTMFESGDGSMANPYVVDTN
ncbi:MAG: hypothetical protein IKQ06_01755 [Bacilli bacterium]|nr:hypothetical protein [Bacilli bacterium]